MKVFRVLVVAAGVAIFVVLLRRAGPAVIGHLLLRIGPGGLALILGQEIVAKTLNAAGWRLGFPESAARSLPMRRLLAAGIACDGVNYLVPTGTVAGEVTRVSMLRGSATTEVATASVLVARFAEALGQGLFVTIGFLAVAGRLAAGSPAVRSMIIPAAAAAAVLLLLLAGYRIRGHRWIGAAEDARNSRGRFRRVIGRTKGYFREHPSRFTGSIGCFSLAFAWGTFEAYWICRFLGLPVSVGVAFSIEVFSVAIDALFFLVPAKIGTQELGKVAVFSLLGLPTESGLAFGIVRHARELVWAAAGLGLAAVHRAREGSRPTDSFAS